MSEQYPIESFSEEGKTIIGFMLKHLSSSRYVYKSTASGSYDAAINNYGFDVPPESKDIIVEKVIQMLNAIYG